MCYPSVSNVSFFFNDCPSYLDISGRIWISLEDTLASNWQDLSDGFCAWVETQFRSAERDVTVRLIKFSLAERLALDFTESRAPELLEADTN